jgi:hypothetical protein
VPVCFPSTLQLSDVWSVIKFLGCLWTPSIISISPLLGQFGPYVQLEGHQLCSHWLSVRMWKLQLTRLATSRTLLQACARTSQLLALAYMWLCSPDVHWDDRVDTTPQWHYYDQLQCKRAYRSPKSSPIYELQLR